MKAAGYTGIPRRRWLIGGLLGVGVLINYFDRLSIAVVAPSLQHELHLDPLQLGVLLSAFSWSYSVFQLPSGMLIDRFGVSKVGRISILLWGVASLMAALAGGYGGIMLARICLGAAEAPSFPLSSKATGYWFPRNERSVATSLFDGTSKLANAVGVPLVAVALVLFGWRGAFGMTAALSFLFLILFWVYYRDPSDDKSLSRTEHEYILRGGATQETKHRVPVVAMVGHVLRQRRVWAILLGFASFGYLKSYFEYWLPSYMVHSMNVSILKSAAFTSIPWIAGTIVQFIVGGWLVDWLVTRGHDETPVRKTILLGSIVVGASIVCVALTSTPFWALFWITASMCGLSTMATISWSLPSLISPRGGTAIVGGLMNLMGGLTGSVQSIITGYIVKTTDSFDIAFVVAGLVFAVGLLSYGIVLDRVAPVVDLEESTGPLAAGLANAKLNL